MSHIPEIAPDDAKSLVDILGFPTFATPGGSSEQTSSTSVAEHTLFSVLYLLIGSDDVDLDQMLHNFAGTIDAAHLTLYVLEPGDVAAGAGQLSLFDKDDISSTSDARGSHHRAPRSLERHRAEAQPEDGGRRAKVEMKPASRQEELLQEILRSQISGWVFPIISPTQTLYGYLDACPSEDHEVFGKQESRALHYLCNLLASYFDRRRNSSSGQGEEGPGAQGGAASIEARLQADRRIVEALEKQRSDIGRELHDNIGQLLTGIRMLGENLGNGHSAENNTDKAGRIAKMASEAAVQVSNIHQQLSASHLCEVTLAEALEGLARRMDELSEVRCFFSCEEARVGETVNQHAKLQLYRIAQEAVSNALKYAQAERVQIVLEFEEERPTEATLILRIQDDGQGFDPDRSSSKPSSGLRNMVYRARAAGGSLQIEATPGTGVDITCTLPSSGWTVASAKK